MWAAFINFREDVVKNDEVLQDAIWQTATVEEHASMLRSTTKRLTLIEAQHLSVHEPESLPQGWLDDATRDIVEWYHDHNGDLCELWRFERRSSSGFVLTYGDSVISTTREFQVFRTNWMEYSD